MDYSKYWERLSKPDGGKIVTIVMDGLGGLQNPKTGKTELQTASTPNLDNLAKKSVTGLLDIVGPGITPGSGPGHLSLFGYDPFSYEIGRGIFSALGIDFDLQEGDVACRINFATVDKEGVVRDRRAGRIETSLNRTLCKKIKETLEIDHVEFHLETESEYRAVLILRGKDLYGNIKDTDPQSIGLMLLDPIARDKKSEKTAELIRQFIAHVRETLKNEEKANMVLTRGFETYHPVPGIDKRFHLKGLCLADYPMYRGVSRFIGMDVISPPGGFDKQVAELKKRYDEKYDFFFLHMKYTDSSGEDGNFERKCRMIELVDSQIPEILSVNPDVLVVTGDHSTPAVLKGHSWHPVPVLLHAKTARIDRVETFDEIACIQGGLGHRKGVDLMGLSLAHALRLKKFGA